MQKYKMNSNYGMAEGSSRAMYNAEEVIGMITEDRDQEDDVGDLFFPGSDDEFGFEEVIVMGMKVALKT